MVTCDFVRQLQKKTERRKGRKTVETVFEANYFVLFDDVNPQSKTRKTAVVEKGKFCC